MDSPTQLGHPLSDGPLPFGRVALWTDDYQEFACSRSTYSWMQAGGMTHLDGQPIVLRVVDEFAGGNVMVKWRRQEDE